MTEYSAFSIERAAALSGVPKSTVYLWKDKRYVVPSIREERIAMWSLGDLLKLRAMYWLRRPKVSPEGESIPPTSMKHVRRALARLKELEPDVWRPDSEAHPAVDRRGHVFLRVEGVWEALEGHEQAVFEELLDLLGPFTAVNGIVGPDLRRPRAHLRIIPGLLSGAPHVVGTRIPSESIRALHRLGHDVPQLTAFYGGDLDPAHVEEAIDLEKELERNVRVRAPAAA